MQGQDLTRKLSLQFVRAVAEQHAALMQQSDAMASLGLVEIGAVEVRMATPWPTSEYSIARIRGAKPDRRRWWVRRAAARAACGSAHKPARASASSRRKDCRPAGCGNLQGPQPPAIPRSVPHVPCAQRQTGQHKTEHSRPPSNLRKVQIAVTCNSAAVLAPSGSPTTSTPEIVAAPASASSTPASIRMVVVFPAPSGPTMPKISPAFTSKLRSIDGTHFTEVLAEGRNVNGRRGSHKSRAGAI